MLLDNNSKIRYEAFLLIDHIPIHCTVINDYFYLNLLLSKFFECNVHNKCPEFTCIVLFYWSIALLDNTDYEMDDTDVSKLFKISKTIKNIMVIYIIISFKVFNKCTNYEFFEPVEVSRICAEFLIKNTESYMDIILPDEDINWINSLLNVKFQKSISFKTLIRNYESYLPFLENKLHDILNPTYKNKLFQILVYKQYKKIL